MSSVQGFAIGDIVRTIKGANFWGRIIAFDSDLASPGCTVMAIADGFAGTKHVYPLTQLSHVPATANTHLEWTEDEKVAFVTLGHHILAQSSGGGSGFSSDHARLVLAALNKLQSRLPTPPGDLP